MWREEEKDMNRGDIIATINGINFYYGGWNCNGWHLVFTNTEFSHIGENFHVENDILNLPTKRDCQLIYHNYYE